MMTYDPSVDSLSSPIPDREEVPVNEELALMELARGPVKEQKSVPTGLLRLEKKIDESHMADFSTPIEELMPGPNQALQNDVMMAAPSARVMGSPPKAAASSKNPGGLTDEQFQAAIAGVAAVVAFSKPVQSKLRSMVPKFLNDSGDMSLTGLLVTALIVALLFYFGKKFTVNP